MGVWCQGGGHRTLVIAMRGKNEAFVSLVRDLASDRTCRLTAPLQHSSMIHKIVEHTYICVEITLQRSKQYLKHNISIKIVGSCPVYFWKCNYFIQSSISVHHGREAEKGCHNEKVVIIKSQTRFMKMSSVELPSKALELQFHNNLPLGSQQTASISSTPVFPSTAPFLAPTGALIVTVVYYIRSAQQPLFEISSISANIFSFSFCKLNADW